MVSTVALYFLTGYLIWRHIMITNPEGLDNPLTAAHFLGCSSLRQELAFLTVQGFFLLFWPLCVAFYWACRIVHILRG